MKKQILIIFCFIFSLSSCRSSKKEIVQTKFLMDTICEIKIYCDDENYGQEIVDKVFKKIEEVDKQFGYTSESEITKINLAAGKNKVKVSSSTFELISKSIGVSELTNGAFDITTGVLSELWGFENFSKKTSFVVPKEEEIKKALSLVGYDKILLDKNNQVVFLKKPMMKINLGGIAKGYALKVAKEMLEEYNIKKFLLNFGGDIYVRNNLDKKPWRVAVQHPRDRQKYICVLDLFNTSIATSGDYERYFFYEGKRYHHIFDPHAGYPANNGIISVSVVIDDPITADALSTAMFVLGEKEAISLAEKLNAEYIIVKEENNKIKVITSQRIKKYISEKYF